MYSIAFIPRRSLLYFYYKILENTISKNFYLSKFYFANFVAEKIYSAFSSIYHNLSK